MIVLGLDPGPTQSAILIWDGTQIENAFIQPNQFILDRLKDLRQQFPKAFLVIEKIESFGMAVGAETFETVWWSGRFAEAYGIEHVGRLGRRLIKLHLCQSARATDANIRQAILDRFGGKDIAIGKKAAPGPLYHVKSHLWAALAITLTWHDQHSIE